MQFLQDNMHVCSFCKCDDDDDDDDPGILAKMLIVAQNFPRLPIHIHICRCIVLSFNMCRNMHVRRYVPSVKTKLPGAEDGDRR